MTRNDYEERRQRMDEELRRAGIELLQAAHAAQVRALDLVWMSSGAKRPASAREEEAAADRPALRGRLCRGGSLYRVLQELLAEKLFAVEVRGEGSIPTKYRKLGARSRSRAA